MKIKKTKQFSYFALLFTFVLGSIQISCSSGNEKNNNETKIVNTDDAVEYNEAIVALHSEADNALAALLFAIEEKNYEEILKEKEIALITIKNVKSKVYELKDFDGNDEFKKELIKIMEVYEVIINEELSTMIYLHEDFASLTESDLEHYNSLFADALDKYDIAFNDFAIYQTNFAEKWNFDLQ